MQGSDVLLELAGAVALLVWSTRMVRTGVERAFGAGLRHQLSHAFRNRLTSAVAGLILALLLQSSTAVVIMTTGFVTSGYLAAVPAVAAVVGADLGSALLALVLRMDLSVLIPILLLAGMVAFRSSEARVWRQWGRILFGLGLLLLSLRLIGEAAEPLRQGEGVPLILGVIGDDPALVFLISALTAWLFHSSLAAILLAALLAGQGIIATDLILPIVLGINLGGAVMALSLTRGAEGDGRIVPLANVTLRGAGAVTGLLAAMQIPFATGIVAGADPGMAVVLAHVAFNAAVMVSGLVFAGPLCRLLTRVLARRPQGLDRLSALVDADLASPDVALRNAGREALALSGLIETMLARLPNLVRHGDDEDFAAMTEADRDVDRRYALIKGYLTRIDPVPGNDRQSKELARLLRVVVRLEQVGDVIAQRVAVRARKKKDRNVEFSDEGWAELDALFAEVMVSARLGSNVVATDDIGIARRLVEQKSVVRDIERHSTAHHLERLREGRIDSRDSSALHLDTLYDLKEINSLLVEIGYPLLEGEGQLRDTRLRAKNKAVT